MTWMLTKGLIAAVIVVGVSEVSNRHPRLGGLLLSLPIVSLIAFAFTWQQHHDLPNLSRLARETVVLVLIGMPFFLPIALAGRLNLGFWPAYFAGIVLAAASIGAWLWLGPKSI
ncbi:MAG: DUF3147 family protein [Phycisphaerae bacterium]|nr:DUF3147 family protein [Phycisphaerae bacterium]